MIPQGQPGQIVTFYSYKGGTGRTMAMANVACVLAQSYSKKVLVIDWDLEAPGLHRYFKDLMLPRGSSARSKEASGDSEPGLIELLTELRSFVESDLGISAQTPATLTPQSSSQAEACVARLDLNRYIDRATIDGLFVLKAGAFNESYSRTITSFPWEKLYNASPWLFTALANRLAGSFDFVLIDSRTGLTDTSGICTMIMPQTLVLVFTPNRQSYHGALQIAEKAAQYRRKSSDLRPLMIMPLVSRVEAAKPELRDKWRFGDGQGWEGFQRGFENLFTSTYELDELTLKVYFDRIQIKHIPDYAYGEPIAVLVEKSEDVYSLRSAYQEFCTRLVEGLAPWDLSDEAAVATIQRKVAEERAEAAELSVRKTKRTLKLVSASFGAVFLVFLAFVGLLTSRKHTAGSASLPSNSPTSTNQTETSTTDAPSRPAAIGGASASTVPEAVPLAQLHANEDSAITSMLQIGQAEIAYLQENGGRTCLKLSYLGPPPKNADSQAKLKYAHQLDEQLASGTKSGYRFELACTGLEVKKPPRTFWYGFMATATPAKPYSGYRRFCIMEDGIVREFKGSEGCREADPLPNVRTQGLALPYPGR